MRSGSRWGIPGRAAKAGRAPLFKHALAIAAVAASGFLAGCMGGSDGIENPKVELEFRGPDGNMSGTGEVRVYARHLNPVEDSKPILTKTFSGKAAFTLTRDEMDSVLSLKLGGAVPDTTVDFNVVAVSGEREAFVAGFRYKRAKAGAGFAHAAWSKASADLEFGGVKKSVDLLAALEFKGALGTNGMAYGIDYVFIPGSPYYANVTQEAGTTRGEFRILRMSRGTYENLIGADKDSAHFYESRDTLNTSDTEYTAKTWNAITIYD